MRRTRPLSRREALAKAAQLTYGIYALVDPRDMLPRYVGRSLDPATRIGGHIKEARWVNPKKHAWIRELRRATGSRPFLLVLASVRGTLNAVECEQFWVDHGRMRGWPLLNAPGSRFKGNLGLGRNQRDNGRYWTIDTLGLKPRHWPTAA